MLVVLLLESFMSKVEGFGARLGAHAATTRVHVLKDLSTLEACV